MSAALTHGLWVSFVVLACWHFFMALHPASGSAAVPSVDGKALFQPSRGATAAVGAGLLLVAALVGATAGLIDSGLNRALLGWLCYALAIGDFKYLGFFKRVKDSRFATLARNAF